MNKTTELYGQGARFDTALIVATCTVWLVEGIFMVFTILTNSLIENSTGETLRGMLVSSASCVFTVSMLWVIRKNVLDFIDIKASVEE